MTDIRVRRMSFYKTKLETFRILHQNLFVANGGNKRKQI